MPRHLQFALPEVFFDESDLYRYYKQLLDEKFKLLDFRVFKDISSNITHIFFEVKNNLRLESFGKTKFVYLGLRPRWVKHIHSSKPFEKTFPRHTRVMDESLSPQINYEK